MVFNELTRDELRKEASKRKIKGYGSLSKEDLLKAVEKHEASKRKDVRSKLIKYSAKELKQKLKDGKFFGVSKEVAEELYKEKSKQSETPKTIKRDPETKQVDVQVNEEEVKKEEEATEKKKAPKTSKKESPQRSTEADPELRGKLEKILERTKIETKTGRIKFLLMSGVSPREINQSKVIPCNPAMPYNTMAKYKEEILKAIEENGKG